MSDCIDTLTLRKDTNIVFITSKHAISASAYPLRIAILHSSLTNVDIVMVKGEIKKCDRVLVKQNILEIRIKAKARLQCIMKNLKSIRFEMNQEEIR
ncbi:unnamed protein product [Penicillium salamii]|uniref:Uncharacterized protein n=1 Tax=Penicillium salamii TaxID=1612424 RepID=A0A9W4JS16_9EURO|nr:unnamed protein product [Penicillium salamii]